MEINNINELNYIDLSSLISYYLRMEKKFLRTNNDGVKFNN